MMNTRQVILTAILVTTAACPALNGEDGGVDRGSVADGGLPDQGPDMAMPVVCDPQEGISIDIEQIDIERLDPETIEGYDGPGRLCIDSSLVGRADCPDGNVVESPGRAGGVCVPRENPELYYRLDSCSDTVFFIERPRWLEGAIPGAAACGGRLDTCLKLFLPLIAERTAYAWFCGPDDIACRSAIGSGDRLIAHLESVLPVDDPPGQELPRRAYRLWFEKDGARVPVRDSASCDLIATIRELVAEKQALIGRECDAPVQKVTAVIADDDPQASWHKERLGLPGADVDGVPVVVVDAGMPQLAFVSALTELSFSGVDPMAPLHSHGLAMALAIRDVAPNATILSVRVMNTGGRGNTADVARGIDRASREDSMIRIFNLSIGLAPETRMARVVNGPGCETVDDGVGEAIAIALDAARERQPQLLAFGSPGNRPLRPAAVRAALLNNGRELVEPGASLRFDDPCRGGARIRGWFFPAMLARCNEGAPIVGVGGISDRDQPIAVAIPGGEPALVAPAQHIFLNDGPPDAPGISRPIEDPICAPVGDGLPPIELPMVVSGTSLSAAFASGAAAWALGQEPSLTAEEIVRLLYVTGRPLCRLSTDNIPVRAISLGRLEAAMTHPNFADVRVCIDVADPEFITADLRDGCAAALDAVGLVDMCEVYLPIGWPEDYLPEACDGLETAGPQDAAELPPCDMACRMEVQERALGRGLVGEAGPQPDKDFCPECALTLRRDIDDRVQTIDLEIELWDGFEKETVFEEPWLIVKDVLSSNTYVIDIDDYSDVASWTAGAVAKVTSIPATKIPGGEDPTMWETALVPSIQANVIGTGGIPTAQTAALRVNLKGDE